MEPLSKIKSVLFGVAVGDALGVPVEFKSREQIRKNPISDMTGYGTHHQAPGTFSDDSSLTFCLAEALTEEFDTNTIGNNFIRWANDNYWTAAGEVFDIGIATREALAKISKGVEATQAGGKHVGSNGNGSLMRIAPLLFYIMDKPVHERYEITKQVSSITHAHLRSVIACFYYLEFAGQILSGVDKKQVYKNLQTEVKEFLISNAVDEAEISVFDRLLKKDIYKLPEDEISSSGYVLHTLEASIWCLMNTGNYKDAVLKAVNLGEDTDTTAAVTDGLAGLVYGYDNIPAEWIDKLARTKDISGLAVRMEKKLFSADKNLYSIDLTGMLKDNDHYWKFHSIRSSNP